MKIISLSFFVACTFLLFTSLATAATPKSLVNEIFNTKESLEKAVRGGQWAEADKNVVVLEKQMKELVLSLNADNADGTNRKISLIAGGMHKAIAEQEDEEYEEPAHAMMTQLLNLMNSIDYGKPAVFVIIKRQVTEAMELVDEAQWESLEEEMEEIVNVRSEARSSARKAGLNEDKVDVILDLAWDISRDADRRNGPSAKKRLERMASIIDSL